MDGTVKDLEVEYPQNYLSKILNYCNNPAFSHLLTEVSDLLDGIFFY